MFTGTSNVSEPPWLSRVKNLEHFPSFSLAQGRLNSSVASLQTEQQRIAAEALKLQSLHDQQAAKKAADRAKLLQETAMEQRRQIQALEARKKEAETAKKEPGISPFLCGYPSIPLTPPDVRHQRKLDQQQFLKTELELQAAQHQASLAAHKAESQRQSQLMLEAAEKVGQTRQIEEAEKKRKNREEMRRSWEQASFHKSGLTSPAQSAAGSAVSQHGWSEYAEKFQDFKPTLAIATAASQSIPAKAVPVVQSPTVSTSQDLNGSVGALSRKQIAARLKAREDQRAKASLQDQIAKLSRSPMLQKAGKLISHSGASLGAARSLSQPHLSSKASKEKAA